jgi:hypothetical protein
MIARGHVQGGVVVLPDGVRLAEGQEVTVFAAGAAAGQDAPAGPDAARVVVSSERRHALADLIGIWRLPMAARFENSRRFRAQMPNVLAAIDGALRDIGVTVIEWSADRHRVTGKIGVSFWSWGERLTASVDESGEVQVSSVCSFPLQIIDWGKNAENCRKFLASVASRLGSEVPA